LEHYCPRKQNRRTAKKVIAANAGLPTSISFAIFVVGAGTVQIGGKFNVDNLIAGAVIRC
jgi:hypothetical protein